MAQTKTAYNRIEMLQAADVVAREKSIDREQVLEAMEAALQKAAKAKYGPEHDIRATIDRQTGETQLYRYRQVADPIENEFTQITLEAAQDIHPDAKIGDFLTDPLPAIDLGRINAQTAKQVIVQRVRDAERERQYNEYKDRAGEIVNGIVKRVDFGNVTVDLGRAEAVMRRDETIPRETFKVSDRVRAYIYDVRKEARGPQIFLSRTHPQFVAKLFAQEVPEIYDGIIEIKSVARDPGRRSRARRSTSFPGRPIPRPSWSTRWRRPRSPRSFWTRKTTASRSWCRTTNCRWRSAAAARMCASPRC